jgi:hypothetical protein
VTSSVDTRPVQKTVEPLAESKPKISVVSKDTAHARAGDAVAVKTPGAEVSRAVNKTETSDLRDSTVIGCSKCEELPKDRFTKVSDSGYYQYSAALICRAIINDLGGKKLACFLNSCRYKHEATSKKHGNL